jgi:hypothetical protein
MVRNPFSAFLFFCLLAPLFPLAQTLKCSDVKNGTFIYFSKTDGSRSTYIRNGAVQKELNAGKHETIMWDVEWVDDCSYFLSYNSGWENKPKDDLKALRKHKFLIRILDVTPDYYIFRSSLDKASNPAILTDTLWIKLRRDRRNKSFANPRIDSLLAGRPAATDSARKPQNKN